jgi:hypothetical protein
MSVAIFTAGSCAFRSWSQHVEFFLPGCLLYVRHILEMGFNFWQISSKLGIGFRILLFESIIKSESLS